ncbi:MAG: YlmC/YmxH family sporulation protein [Clostridiaceae bacterium]|nr:YlmC/YmxH family sporulation protein [Clostridiaceae bacterium]MDD6273292.1 YlmC/YmxH family sporulation protein [Clostridiaceae bacterium]
MGTRIADLQCKEVVNICDGARMGFVNDVELDICTGRLVAIVVPGPWSFSCLFAKGEEFVVPWCQIEKIGDDIILVRFDTPPQSRRRKRERRHKFFI